MPRTLRSSVLATVSSLMLFGSAAAVRAQNPVIDQWRSGSAHYDPFNDHLYVDRERVRVRESALDPHRSHIDPGSKHYVDRYIRNASGQTIREYGWTWTSHGVPHGKLTRERVTSYRPGCRPGGGWTERDRDTVIYSPGRGGVTQRDRDTVIYSQPHQPRRGGVTERDRDTVIFSTEGNNRNNNGRQGSSGNSLGRQLSNQLRSSLFGG